jgi:hypothetical protein
MELDVRIAHAKRVGRPEHALADRFSACAKPSDKERVQPLAAVDASRYVLRSCRNAAGEPDVAHDVRIAPQRRDERRVVARRYTNDESRRLELHAGFVHVRRRGSMQRDSPKCWDCAVGVLR